MSWIDWVERIAVLLVVIVFVAVVAVLLGACHPLPPPSPAPESDGSCAAACSNLVRLDCLGADGNAGPDGKRGTPDDATCERACAELEAEGIVALNTQCVADARTCEEVDACN